MKLSNKILTSLLTITILSINNGVVIVSAVPITAETTGQVNFERDDNQVGGNPVEPGSNNPLKPVEQGVHTDGALRLEYVPSFKFGKKKISSSDQVYSANWNFGHIEGSTKLRKIPHMIQVTDERGSTEGFNVTVSATTFKDSNGANELENTRMQFAQQTLVNSNDAVAENILSGLEFDNNQKAIINDQARTILSTKIGETADGSKSFNVFSENYVHSEFFDESKKLPEENSGVELFTPSRDLKKASVAYEATLTWTIGSEL